MKRWIAAAAIVLGLSYDGTADIEVRPEAKPCAWCSWSGTCYNHRICGAGCICVKRRPLDIGGFCASIE